MQVTKMSSLGNEILILDLLTKKGSISSQEVKKISLEGITSFDQLITIEPPRDPDNHIRSSIYNRDGSQAENCMNGSRCVAKYVTSMGLISSESFIIETIGGNWKMQTLPDDIFSTEIPCPSFEPKDLPFLSSLLNKYSLEKGENTLEIGIASLGNPHIISFMSDINSFPLGEWGESLKNNPKFPEGVNLGVCSILTKKEIDLRVFERGVGETLGCGSGACAAVAIGNNQGLLDPEVIVNFKTGSLKIEYKNKICLKASGNAIFHDEYEV